MSVKSAQRVLDILELLSDQGGRTFPELVAALDLPKSSLHGLLDTLQQRNWLTLDSSTRQFTIGVQAWQVGQGFDKVSTLAQLARQTMQDAVAGLGETIELAVLDGTDALYVAKAEAPQALRLVSQVGSRLPAHATALGKVLLADRSDDDIRALYRGRELTTFTARTAGTLDQLLKEIATTRRRGYGRANGDHTEGVACFAVPIRTATNEVIASLSCAAPEFRLASSGTNIRALVGALQGYADEISAALGHRQRLLQESIND